MRAIFLAAGMGTRARAITLQYPKCLLKVNGKSLLQHAFDNVRSAGISDIVVVTGYQHTFIERVLPSGVRTRRYPAFESTNNLCTLAFVSDLLTTDVIIAFSDVFMPASGWFALSACDADSALLVDRSLVTDKTMRVTLIGDLVADVGSHIPREQGHGTFTGLAKFTGGSALILAQCVNKLSKDPVNHRAYYTEAVRAMIQAGHMVMISEATTLIWGEIDTPDDYDRIVSRFC
jgi:L-glutamine-phosphate cytidylyltransferase